MEKALERAYGLKDVLIVENSVLDTRWENASYMFGSASDYLYSFFKEGDIVGVAMGHTLNSVVNTNKTYEKLNDLMFVTLEGGISQGTVECTDVQGNELVRKFADKLRGTYTQFLSPAVFSDKAILDSFMKEKAVNYILDDFKKINVVVVGIGIPGRIDHTLVRAGYMTNKELKYLSANGAVGDMCLQFFDRNGDTSLFSQYNDRVAAMRLQDIRKVPSKIGIAGGKKKAEAVAGAVRGGFINILIIDSECAKELIDMINE